MGNQPGSPAHRQSQYGTQPPQPTRPASSSFSRPPAQQQQQQQHTHHQPQDVRCPGCSKVLRPPAGAARFRCPCGKVLSAPAPASTTAASIPSQTRSVPPQPQPQQSTITSQTRSVPPQRPAAAASSSTPHAHQHSHSHGQFPAQRVRCPRCQQILLSPAGAPQFSCPCGQMLRAPPVQQPQQHQPSAAAASTPQRPAPTIRAAPPPPTTSAAAAAATPSRVRCPNCSRVLDCPRGQRIFPCVCGVHLTAPNAPPPPPAAAAAPPPAASAPAAWELNKSEDLPTAEALLSAATQKDVGCWRRTVHGDAAGKLAWMHVLSESDDARILQAEQQVIDAVTPTVLAGMASADIVRRLQQFGPELVDLRGCVERQDFVSLALNLSMNASPSLASLPARQKCQDLGIDISKCRTDHDVAQRLFAFVWSEGKTFSSAGNVERNAGLVRMVTLQGTLQWTPAEEFLINMGSKPRAQEVYDLGCSPSFLRKSQWFRQECAKMLLPWETGHVKVVVKRDTCLEDAFNHVYNLPAADMHRYFRYEFAGEPGLDAGGIAREWFTLVTDQVFNADVGLMEYSQAGNLTYQISANSQVANGSGHLAWFRFIGRVLGRALFEGQQIGPHLTRILYKHMLAWPVVEEDLEFVDDEMFKSVGMLREMDPASVADLCLDFTTTKSVFGDNVQVELCPGGAEREVTGENLDEFLELRLKHSCMNEFQPQLFAFLNGFYEVIPLQLLSVFNFFELELLLCGLPHISVEDWRRNTTYRGEYAAQGERHPVISMFWTIIQESNEEQRAKFLQFATGTSRVPVQGFSALQGNDGNIKLFTIDSVPLQQSVFPRAHTCFNRIDLPLYQNKVDMKFRMAQALQLEGVGFQIE